MASWKTAINLPIMWKWQKRKTKTMDRRRSSSKIMTMKMLILRFRTLMMKIWRKGLKLQVPK